MKLERRLGYWTHDDLAAGKIGEHLYYFAPTNRAPGPYLDQREVLATIDIAQDGTLAGVELIENMPPPPSVSRDAPGTASAADFEAVATHMDEEAEAHMAEARRMEAGHERATQLGIAARLRDQAAWVRLQTTSHSQAGPADGDAEAVAKKILPCICSKNPDADVHTLHCPGNFRKAVVAALKQAASPPDEVRRLREALERIERWFGEFPPTGKAWPSGEFMSYSAAYGSNGERDYMRSVARAALSAQGER